MVLRSSARALIIGGGGQLGRALLAALGDGATAPSRDALDVSDPEAVSRMLHECRPDLVVNAAAYNDVDGAESDRERSIAVNADGPAHLVRGCEEVGARLVHVSSDYVFDGSLSRPYSEDDPPAPLGVYGASKLAGERAVLGARCPRLVVRTSGVFGEGGSRVKGGNFVDRILSRARQGLPLHVVCDQVFSPTYARDLASALLTLVERSAAGLIHVTNSGSCSWHELAVATLRLAGSDAAVGEIRSSELARPARRPAYSVLSNARYQSLGLQPLRHWREALSEFLGR